jgi:hypothetical protein
LGPAGRDKIVAVMEDWERHGRVLPDWTVKYDVGDGCYRTTFTVCALVEDPTYQHPGYRYSFTEAQLCQYVLGLVDLAPERAGEAARVLADESREEVSR